MGDKRILKLDALRGIAVSIVCFCHFTVPTKVFTENYFIRDFGKYGKYGVEIFFMISGFVLVFAMDKANYSLDRFFHFFRKRLLRIEIPYLSAAILMVVIGYLVTLAPLYKGVPFKFDWLAWLGHLAYINHYNSWEWISPIFWTLAIEFQFYFLIALVFPLVVNRKHPYIRYVVYALMILTYIYLVPGLHVFRFSVFFIAGIESFMFFKNYSSKMEYFIMMLLITVLTYILRDLEGALCVIFFMFYMNVPFYQPKFLVFLGKISFSLYMLHGVFGGKLQNLAVNFIGKDLSQLIFLPFVFLFSVLMSYLFWRMVEKPAMKISNKFSYSKTNTEKL